VVIAAQAVHTHRSRPTQTEPSNV